MDTVDGQSGAGADAVGGGGGRAVRLRARGSADARQGRRGPDGAIERSAARDLHAVARSGAHGSARRRRKPRACFAVALLGRAVPVLHTDEGLRAVGKDQAPVSPASVEKYLKSKFGEALPAVRAAMVTLAKSRRPEVLADEAFHLYEQFRPSVPAGEAGWGAKGTLSLAKIVALAERQEIACGRRMTHRARPLSSTPPLRRSACRGDWTSGGRAGGWSLPVPVASVGLRTVRRPIAPVPSRRRGRGGGRRS